MNQFSEVNRFLSRTTAVWAIVTALLLAFSLTACGRKAPLYIPTDAQKTQMKKDQAERDAILKARAERAKKANETEEIKATVPDTNTPPTQP